MRPRSVPDSTSRVRPTKEMPDEFRSSLAMSVVGRAGGARGGERARIRSQRNRLVRRRPRLCRDERALQRPLGDLLESRLHDGAAGVGAVRGRGGGAGERRLQRRQHRPQLPGQCAREVSAAHLSELHAEGREVGRGHRLVRSLRPRVAVEARLSRSLRVATRLAHERLHPAELRVPICAGVVDWWRPGVRDLARRAAPGNRPRAAALARRRRTHLRPARNSHRNAVRECRSQGHRHRVGLQRGRARKARRGLANRRALSLEDEVQVRQRERELHPAADQSRARGEQPAEPAVSGTISRGHSNRMRC